MGDHDVMCTCTVLATLGGVADLCTIKVIRYSHLDSR